MRQRVTAFGFYLYLLSDAILFAGLFATFAVLHNSTDGGPSGHDLFSLKNAYIETALLLTSSLTCGMAMLACDNRNRVGALFMLGLTFLLGAAFLNLELSEFRQLITDGAGPDRSAFLSSFFTLVSTHGLHVLAGLLWAIYIGVQLLLRGFSPAVMRRFYCFSLFWHVIDVVWIAVFTFVYLIGGRS
ncbi:cytochrome o ubiquinol oxidase subunit III [Undibacterium terreum]|uniref:Cytochrome bo(3) ubiquinol oxidase subunit 3 n=1 Tax=Undibacterium terreum TaxID=1224302 RepID=A0A916XR72_9BURK|nr:cytochrome bo(3) ubiquinol oxidase subunit 3 [Undibacterium terreum]